MDGGIHDRSTTPEHGTHPKSPRMTTPITVLICDDNQHIRTALHAVIDHYPDLTLAATAVNSAEAIDLARHHQPAVAIVDWRMPGGGPHAIQGIREHSPHTGILAFSAHADPDTITTMIQAGADCYLPKSTPIPQIVAALRHLAHTPRSQPE